MVSLESPQLVRSGVRIQTWVTWPQATPYCPRQDPVAPSIRENFSPAAGGKSAAFGSKSWAHTPVWGGIPSKELVKSLPEVLAQVAGGRGKNRALHRTQSPEPAVIGLGEGVQELVLRIAAPSIEIRPRPGDQPMSSSRSQPRAEPGGPSLCPCQPGQRQAYRDGKSAAPLSQHPGEEGLDSNAPSRRS